MSSLLSEKTIFITGASSGFGQACAKLFAAQGANLILCARRETLLETMKQELIDHYGVSIHLIPVDVRNKEAFFYAVDHLPLDFQTIDILINNAGCAIGLETLAEGSVEDWEIMLDTNVKGLLISTRAILPKMIQAQSGHIVNIGSTSAHQVYAKGGVYCATKHAVQAISKALNVELAETAVRVTEIDPGAAETEFSLVRFKGDANRAEAVYKNMHALSAEEVADAVLYAITRPAHVNIAQIMLYSIDQVGAMRPR